MKAIIMAGGEGSRLRPLTCNRPKPLVPVLNRPIMAYCIDLLKKHGITEIGVTLQYLPEAIREYFGDGSEMGVKLHYFVEESPLGTAGSVKNAESFLDETFIVISGDALTDLDLSRALDFHRANQAIGTLVLTRVECPLEYGVVITGRDGQIVRFLEKPSWGEVFSDTVNTGIYVLEPDVLEYFAPNQKFDFSKDLFPLLLRENQRLFGLVLSGYWCDIGNLEQYRQAHYDALSGKVALHIPGREIAPQVWVGDNVHLPEDVKIEGPVVLGSNSRIGSGVCLEKYSVIGDGCMLQDGVSVKRSIIWNHSFVGQGVALRGAIVGTGVQVQAGAGIFEGAVVGDHSVIRERATLKPEVKLWPHKVIEKETIVNKSLVWGTRQTKHLFGHEGVAGLVNVEITPEFCAQLGAVFGSIFDPGSPVVVSSDGFPASRMLAGAAAAGLQSAGIEVLEASAPTTPLHRFAVREFGCRGGMHFKLSKERDGRVTILFTDSVGGNLSRSSERKIENLFAREDYTRVPAGEILTTKGPVKVLDQYLRFLLSGIGDDQFTSVGALIAIYAAHLEPGLRAIAERLGLTLVPAAMNKDWDYSLKWSDLRTMVDEVAEMVVEQKAVAGAVIDADAERLILIDERGRVIQDDLLLALMTLYVLKSGGKTVYAPVSASRALEQIAKRYRGRVVRTKTAPQDFVQKVMAEDTQQFFLHFDSLAALARVLSLLAREKCSLSSLIDEIPPIYKAEREVPVSWEAKGRVIRKLIEAEDEANMELLDGVKVFHPDGWALVLPDPDEPRCKVFSEGVSMEIADSLTEMYINRIKNFTDTSSAENTPPTIH